MAFDGLTTAAVVNELTNKITGSRIDKVYQPQSTMLLLRLRQKRENISLLISSHPVRYRIHLTERSFTNPQSPPMFCMVLRKHIEGGKIISVNQPGLERQVVIEIENKDELGRVVKKYLICEIMGKHSNIILLNNDKSTIIDGMKRYSYAVNQYRQVLPGETYKAPPQQDKIYPNDLDEAKLLDELLRINLTTPVWKGLLQCIEGLGPDTCKEIVYNANLSPGILIEECGEYEFNKLWEELQKVRECLNTGNYSPILIKEKNVYKDFSPLDLQQYPKENKIYYSSISKAIDEFYLHNENQEKFNNLVNNIKKILQKEIKRCSKKAQLQRETINKAQNMEKYKLYGELLTANIYRIKKGMDKIEVTNYYSEEGETLEISLKPELTPAENAQRYFKRYNKASSAAKQAQVQLENTLEELNYLQNTLFWVQNATTLEEVNDIKKELLKSGYIALKEPQGKKKKSKETTKRPQPLSYTSQDGFKILVGKNNTVNDYLTLKIASDSDIWLHAKDMPGSHVIIRCDNQKAPESTLQEAAILAAYYSKGKNSTNVPVDYTLKKYVRKPKGAKPGMVIYDNHRTLYVTPDPGVVEDILQRQQK